MLAAIFTAAACAIIYELLISSTSAYFLGDSVQQFSVTIGLFLASMGLGSWLSRAIDDEGLNALLARLRLLYAADPLTESARPSDSGRFSKIYRFADALDEFKALTRRLMKPWTAAQNDDDAPSEAATPVEARGPLAAIAERPPGRRYRADGAT